MNRIKLIHTQLSSNRRLKQNNLSNLLNTLNLKNDLIKVEGCSSNSLIKIITLNNPKSLNALSNKLLLQLANVLNYLNRDPDTKIIILTGTGKSFVAGADIAQFKGTSTSDRLTSFDSLRIITNIYHEVSKPIISAVNGYCLGGGFELAMVCDIIVASDKATFGFPEIKLGLFPGAGGTQRLVRKIGYHKAMEFILTGEIIPQEYLKSAGIVNHIVKHEELIPKSIEIAEKISKFGLVAIVAAKKAMQIAQDTGLTNGVAIEKMLFDSIFSSQDKEIGVNAFIDKKQPVFLDK